MLEIFNLEEFSERTLYSVLETLGTIVNFLTLLTFIALELSVQLFAKLSFDEESVNASAIIFFIWLLEKGEFDFSDPVDTHAEAILETLLGARQLASIRGRVTLERSISLIRSDLGWKD